MHARYIHSLHPEHLPDFSVWNKPAHTFPFDFPRSASIILPYSLHSYKFVHQFSIIFPYIYKTVETCKWFSKIHIKSNMHVICIFLCRKLQRAKPSAIINLIIFILSLLNLLFYTIYIQFSISHLIHFITQNLNILCIMTCNHNCFMIILHG